MGKKNDFNNRTKLKALLCCDRHCCLCGKQCSTSIEVHHIIPVEKGRDNSFDNAMPLCFDCHAKVEMYNDKHPKGTKYRSEELKERRNQIYDKYTSPYLPLIEFKIYIPKGEDSLDLTKSRFKISNLHQYLKCQAKIFQKIYHNKRLLREDKSGDYGGRSLWQLNPHTTVDCPRNFKEILGKKLPKKIKQLQVEITVVLIDKFGYEHELYPVSWIYTPSSGWFYEPFPIKKGC